MTRTAMLTPDDLVLVPVTEPEEWIIGVLNSDKATMFSEQRHVLHSMKTETEYVAGFNHITSHIWRIENSGRQPIGRMTAYRSGHRAEIGILIDPMYWGQHIGSQCWKAVQDWLINTGITKIEAGCMASNEAMKKVFLNNHLVHEGTLRDHFALGNGRTGVHGTTMDDLLLYGRVF